MRICKYMSSDTDNVENEETEDRSVALSLLQLAQVQPKERSLKKYISVKRAACWQFF